MQQSDWTGQDRTGEDRTGQDRIGQGRMPPITPNQDKRGKSEQTNIDKVKQTAD